MLFALALLFAAIRPDQPLAPMSYSVSAKEARYLHAATNGDTALVVWIEGDVVFAARAGRDGVVLDVPNVVVAHAPAYELDVAWVGGHYLVLWGDTTGTYTRRYTADATPLDAAPRKISALTVRLLVSDGTHAMMVATGAVLPSTFYPYFIQRLDADGNPLGSAIPFQEVHAGAANGDGAVFLTGERKSLHVAWNGTMDMPQLVGIAEPLAARIVAGGDRFLVIEGGAALLLDARGTPLGPRTSIFPSPTFTMAAAWSGASWIVGGRAAGQQNVAFRRLGANLELDQFSQVTVTDHTDTIASASWLGTNAVGIGLIGVRPVVMPVDFAERETRSAYLSHIPAEELGGSVATNGTRALVVWSERSGASAFVVRGAFVVGGEVQPPFVISDDARATAPAVASDGRDFLVVWQDGTNDAIFARLVHSEPQSLGPPFPLEPGREPGLAAAWNGTNYVVVTADESPAFAIAVSRGGERLRDVFFLLDYDSTYSARLACDETECALGVRAADKPPMVPMPTHGGVFAARIAADASKTLSSARITLEGAGPPVVAMRAGGVSLLIANDPRDAKTLRMIRLDSGASTPLLTRNVPLQPVVAGRSGFYWTEGDALHWTRIGGETLDLGDVPHPRGAASTSAHTVVVYADDDSRLFVRTFAAIDPDAPPRRRAAGH